MKLAQFTRDPKKIKDSVVFSEEGSAVAKRDCQILVPNSWCNTDLVQIGHQTYICSIYMIKDDRDFYAVSIANCMVRIEPSSMDIVELEGKEYLSFEFDKGATIFPSTKVVRNNKLIYSIFEEFVAKGRVPVFMNYTDLGRIFDSSKYYADVELASTPTIVHAMISTIARDPDNPQIYFRQTTSGEDLERVKFIPMRNSIHAATNTTARMVGSYFSDNLDSALINPQEKEEQIESLLRM